MAVLRKIPSLPGLNAEVLEQHRSTPTSVVKPQGLQLNQNPGLLRDICWENIFKKMDK